MGHRARGLQRRRRRLGLLPARPRPQPRLPLGRGRPRRLLRRPAAAVLRARAVERPRPDPQGAPVRPDRTARATTARTSRSCYYYLDATPTPLLHEDALQVPAGGVSLRASWSRRTAAAARREPEFELLDTGVFDDDRYFDVFVEYAKAEPDDILIRITAHNRGPEAAPICTCCRSSGSATPGRWGRRHGRGRACGATASAASPLEHAPSSGAYCAVTATAAAELLFTRERDQHRARCSAPTAPPATSRTAFHDCVVDGERDAVNPDRHGHEGGGPLSRSTVAAGETRSRSRCGSRRRRARAEPFADVRRVFDSAHRARPTSSTPRCSTASLDATTRAACSARPSPACSGRKQFYHYDVRAVARGRPGAAAAAAGAPAAAATATGRTSTTPTSSRCRTSGSTPGTRPGTWRSTASRWRWSIRSSPRSSSCC